MKTVRTELSEREKKLLSCLVMECKTTGDVHDKMKRLFAGTIAYAGAGAPSARRFSPTSPEK